MNQDLLIPRLVCKIPQSVVLQEILRGVDGDKDVMASFSPHLEETMALCRVGAWI